MVNSVVEIYLLYFVHFCMIYVDIAVLIVTRSIFIVASWVHYFFIFFSFWPDFLSMLEF